MLPSDLDLTQTPRVKETTMTLPAKFSSRTRFFDCADGYPVTVEWFGDVPEAHSWNRGIKQPFRYTTVMSDGAPIDEAEFRELVRRSMSAKNAE